MTTKPASTQTPEEVSAEWLPWLRSPAEATEAEAALAASQYWLPEDEPELTWKASLLIVRSYPEADYVSEVRTEAQAVVGQLAAGPLEDLLGHHGSAFIDRIEAEARRDRRMAWALGGVCQFTMSDELFERVRRAADDTGWK